MKLPKPKIYIQMFCYILLVVSWALLSTHYFGLLPSYVKARYVLNRPTLYYVTETWGIICIIMASYFTGKTIDLIGKN